MFLVNLLELKGKMMRSIESIDMFKILIAISFILSLKATHHFILIRECNICPDL